MNLENILRRMENHEFDRHYVTKEWAGYTKHTYYHKEYDINGAYILERKIVRGKSFDNRENEWYEEESSRKEYTDKKILNFIREHPYWFADDEDFKE